MALVFWKVDPSTQPTSQPSQGTNSSSAMLLRLATGSFGGLFEGHWLEKYLLSIVQST